VKSDVYTNNFSSRGTMLAMWASGVPFGARNLYKYDGKKRVRMFRNMNYNITTGSHV